MIDAGDYGVTPPGSDFLVVGHENFGIVQKVGSQVTQLVPGDHVVTLVRHPGSSWYDDLGIPDMSTDGQYHEHGISLLHGFLTEYYVDLPEQMVKVSAGLREIGVLVEPLSVVEKACLRRTKSSAGYESGVPWWPRSWAPGLVAGWRPCPCGDAALTW